ncbi:NAD(P)-binding protein [Cyathus striatus]|nr:NAD(P)-binding protein [Cyathus striatus]
MSTSKGVAIVTGAAQGIGKAIVIRLANDGFDIGLTDLSTDEQVKKLEATAEEVRKIGRKAIVVPGDVTSEAEVEKLIKDVVAELGGVDVMVANAGICELAPMVDTPVEMWDKTLSINLRGVFLCFKHAGKQMVAQERGGRLIGGGSLSGFSARELGPSGITVNTYAPGVVVTELTLKNYGEAFLEQQKAVAAVNDNGTPEDVAALVAFLASKESRFITGTSFGF